MVHEVIQMHDVKDCPYCGERIKTVAVICRYCRSDLRGATKGDKGELVKIRLKAGEKVYIGDIFLPQPARVSDMINDDRRFVVLSNAVEERSTRDVPIGFIAINKNMTEWIELKTAPDVAATEHPAKLIWRCT
jgi:hypothetical protein